MRVSTGVFTLTAKAADQIETVELTPILQGQELNSSQLRIVSTNADPDKSELKLEPENAKLIANGVSKVTFVLAAKNNENIAIPNLSNLTLSSSEAGIVPVKFIEDNTSRTASASVGLYRASISSNKAGKYIMTAKQGSANIKQIEITSVEPVINTEKSTLTPDNKILLANGESVKTFTLLVKDEDDIGITGLTNLILTSNEPNIPSAKFIEDKSANAVAGTYTAGITSTVEGTYTATAKQDSTDIQTAEFQSFNQTIDSTKSSLTPAEATVIANGTSTAQFTFVAKDADGVPMKGLTLKLATTDTATDAVDFVEDTTTQGVEAGTYKASISASTYSAEGYTLTVMQGESKFNTATLKTTEKAISTAKSSLTPAEATVIANGTSTAQFTFVAKDADGVPMKGLTLKLATTDTATDAVDFVEDTTTQGVEAGTYKASISASTYSAEGYTLTVMQGESKFNTATLKTTEKAISTAKSSLTPAEATVIANGTSTAQFTFVAKDADGVPMKGLTLKLATTDTATDAVDFVEDTTTQGVEAGTYKASISASTYSAEGYTLTVMQGESKFNTATLNATAQVLNSTKSSLTPNPGSVIVNGQSKATFTYAAKDADGVAMAGLTLTLATTDSGTAAANFTEDTATKGTYTAQISASTVGTYTVTVMKDGAAFNTATLNATAPVLPGKSEITTSKTEVTVNKHDEATITLTTKDADGVIIKDDLLDKITFTSSSTNVIFGTTIKESEPGTYSTTIKMQNSKGDYVITPKYNGTQIGKLSITVKAVYQVPSEDYSTMSSSATTTSGVTNLSFTLKDQWQQPILWATTQIGYKILDSSGNVDNSGSVSKQSAATGGNYTAVFTGTSGKKYTIQLLYNNVLYGKITTTFTTP